MSKKSILTAIVSLALVAAVSVGATLAYLSATATDIVNTFTIGDMSIEIDETYEKDSKLVARGEIDKEASVRLTGDDAYVFMKVDVAPNLAALIDSIDYASDWELVDSSNNIWLYKGLNDDYKTVAATGTSNLFTKIALADYDNSAAEQFSAADDKITVKAAAVQWDNMTKAEAITAAQGLFA